MSMYSYPAPGTCRFSVRVPQARLHQLPQILAAINATTLLRLQQGLARVWTRFAYVSGAYVRADVGGCTAACVAAVQCTFLPAVPCMLLR